MNYDNSPQRRLTRKIEELSDQQILVVERFVDSVCTPIYTEDLPETWLATVAWRNTFAAFLQAYHALSEAPLGTLQFEAAFNGASEAAGWQVEPAKSATQRFYDTIIHGKDGIERHVSLKASSAKEIRPDIIHISKLTEAAWIQDARKQVDRRGSIVRTFQEYQNQTSSIFILRAFLNREGFKVFYELAEIPTSVFDQVASLTVRQAKEGTINVPPDSTVHERDFAIRIDGSDAKITLTGIRLDICTVHGRWGLP
jgi:Type II site-specific deoxyribonuclease